MNPAGPAITPNGDSPSSAIEPTDECRRFAEVLAAYTEGETALSDLRHELSETLLEQPGAVAALQALLERSTGPSGISTAIYRLLLRDIKHITTEETPTDPNLRREKSASAKPVASAASAERPKAMQSRSRSPLEPPARQSEPGGHYPAAGEMLRARYELLEAVASGPMGRLFRARDRLKAAGGDARATIALKVLNPDGLRSPEALRRLAHEAGLAQRLGHPNIVNVFELDHHDGHYFITMEWLDGETLAQHLDRTRPQPMSEPEFRRIFGDLARALQYAHETGVVHGDVKPGNVFLTGSGTVKLIDFGLARRPAADAAASSLEQPYGMTQSYASCEVLDGQEATVQDDVFALALLAYRMLAGHRPFGAGDATDARAKGLRPERPAGVNDRQWAALQRGMALSGAERSATVAELAEGLLPAQPGNAAARARKVRRWPWVLVASLAAFAAGVWQAGPVREQLALLSERLQGGEPAAPTIEFTRPRPVAPAPASEPAAAGDIAEQIVAEPGSVMQAPAPEEPSADSPSLANEPIAPTLYLDAAPEPQAAVAPPPPAPTAEFYAPSRPLGFIEEQYTVSEGDGFIRLGIGSPASLSGPVTLQIVVLEGTAVPGEDFAVPATETVVVEPGSDSAEVFVPLIADAEREFIEDFVVRLISLDPSVPVANSEAIVIILDDDGVDERVEFSQN